MHLTLLISTQKPELALLPWFRQHWYSCHHRNVRATLVSLQWCGECCRLGKTPEGSVLMQEQRLSSENREPGDQVWRLSTLYLPLFHSHPLPPAFCHELEQHNVLIRSWANVVPSWLPVGWAPNHLFLISYPGFSVLLQTRSPDWDVPHSTILIVVLDKFYWICFLVFLSLRWNSNSPWKHRSLTCLCMFKPTPNRSFLCCGVLPWRDLSF